MIFAESMPMMVINVIAEWFLVGLLVGGIALFVWFIWMFIQIMRHS